MNARVYQLLQHVKTHRELLTKRSIDDLGRELELLNEDLAMELPRGERAKKRAAQSLLVHRVEPAQHLCERGRRTVHVHRGDPTGGHEDTMRAPALLDQLQRARGARTEDRPQQIAKRGGPKRARELHDSHSYLAAPERAKFVTT